MTKFAHRSWLAAATILAVAGIVSGCSGRGTSSSTTPTSPLTGVWEGTLGRATGDAVKFDLQSSGATLTGSGVFTKPGALNPPIAYGGIFNSGKVSGSAVSFSITSWQLGGDYVVWSFTGTQSGTNLTGNYTATLVTGGSETGAITLTQTGTASKVIGGSWTGIGASSMGRGNVTITMSWTQSGTSLGGTFRIDQGLYAGTGLVVGNTYFGFGVSNPVGTTGYVYGQVSADGGLLSGSYEVYSGTTLADRGIIQVTRPSAAPNGSN